MAKRRSRQQKIDDSIVDLINEMFRLAGHEVTYEDIVGREDAWYNDWTITESQYDEWQKFGQAYLKKNLGMRKQQTEREMAMIGLMWGLKFEKDKYENSNSDPAVDLADRL
jgi:hypothetical protein